MEYEIRLSLEYIGKGRYKVNGGTADYGTPYEIAQIVLAGAKRAIEDSNAEIEKEFKNVSN